MTTLEVVLIAAAIIAALVVLYKLWVKVIIPTWDALVVAWDWIVDAYDVVMEFISDYIIYPIKAVKTWIRRKFFQTDLENIIEDRDNMRKSADKLETVVAMGFCDPANVEMLRDGADQIDAALIDAGLIKEGE